MYYNNPQSSGTAPNAPSAVTTACQKFVKSPLILCAIAAYTCYTAIAAIQGIGSLEYLDDCFQLFELSFLLGIGSIIALLMFIPPIIITYGLWSMYNSNGKFGADPVRSGINANIGMIIGFLSCYLLAILTAGGDLSGSFGEILEHLLFPLAYFCFSLVAVASLRDFADSVQSTACGGKAYTGGVSRSGTLMVIYLFLTLLIYMDVIDTIDVNSILSMISEMSDNSLYEIASISHIATFVLFCIATFIYCDTMNRAKAVDDSTPVAAPATTGWKCSCGRVNPDYCSTCVCGASKSTPGNRQNQFASARPQPQTTEPASAAKDYVFCTECGAKCSGQAKFCKACGNKLGE